MGVFKRIVDERWNTKRFVKEFQKTAGISNYPTALKYERAFIETLKNVLLQGDSVTFTNFGTFDLTTVKERKNRYDVVTKEYVTCPSHKRVRFLTTQGFWGNEDDYY